MATGCSNEPHKPRLFEGVAGLLAVLCILRGLAFTARTHVVPFYPELMERLGVGYTGIGMLFSAYMLTYAIALTGAGALSDRYSPRLIMGSGLLLMAAGTFALAVVPWYWVALFARMIQGIGTAAVYACSLKLVATRFPRENRGRALSAIEVVIGGAMLVTLAVFPVLSQWVSLVTLFLVLGAALLAGLLLLPLLPTTAIQVATGPAALGQNGPQKATPLLTRPVLVLASAAFLGLFVVNGFFGWLPTYFSVSLGMGKEGSGLLMAVLLISEMMAAPLAGMASDRWKSRLSAIQIGSVMLCLACLAAIFGKGSGMAYMVAITAGIAIGWAISPLQALATETGGPNQAGLIASITSSAGQAGGVLAGIIFGWIIDVTGSFQFVWILALALGLARVVVVFRMRERPAVVQEEAV